jgi:hypothetical protein
MLKTKVKATKDKVEKKDLKKSNSKDKDPAAAAAAAAASGSPVHDDVHVLCEDAWNKQQQVCVTSLSQFDPSIRYVHIYMAIHVTFITHCTPSPYIHACIAHLTMCTTDCIFHVSV